MRKIFYREAVKKARKLLNRKAAGRMIFHTRKIFRMHSRLWKMKKVIAVFISLLMILSLAACGNSASQTGQPSTEEKPMESTADNVGSVESGTSVENTEATEKQPEETEDSGNADIPEDSEEQGTKVLVAYFSATNTTQGIAEHIANGLNADIYEIVPEEPYTDADLNYNDNNSRTTIEMNDPDARPAISGSVEDMEQYDIVFIGYPKMEYGFNCVLCA